MCGALHLCEAVKSILIFEVPILSTFIWYLVEETVLLFLSTHLPAFLSAYLVK